MTSSAQQRQPRHVSVLLISNKGSDIDEVKNHLGKTMGYFCTLLHCKDLAETKIFFKEGNAGIDLILLDLSLINGKNPREIFNHMQDIAGYLPIIIFTERDDHELALMAIEAGASDNVTRGQFSSDPFKLRDAIEFAIARQKISKKAEQKNLNILTQITETNAAHLRDMEDNGQAGLQEAKLEAACAIKDLRKSTELLIEKDHTISWLSGGYSVENIVSVHNKT